MAVAEQSLVDGSTCASSCTQPTASEPLPQNLWITGIEGGFYNALTLCLQVPKKAPNRIVVIGGCRQRQLAEFLAFTYPDAKIALIDPDADQVAQAKADIHCRFHFMHAPVEAIPLPDDSVDWVIGHQLLDYVSDWPAAAQEIGRISKGMLVLSMALPWRTKLVRLMPRVSEWLTLTGCQQVTAKPWNDVLTPLMPIGKVKKFLEPLPWRLIALEVNPVKEQRLVLP